MAHDFQDALVALLLAGKAWYLAASTTLNAVRKMLKAGTSLALAPLRLSAATGRVRESGVHWSSCTPACPCC